MASRSAIGLLLAFSAGFLLARLTGGHPAEIGKDDLRGIESRLEQLSLAASTGAPPGGARCVATVDGESIRAELRQALESARDGTQSAVEMGASADAKKGARAAPGPKAIAALEKGRELISQALSRQTWGDEQAGAFRLALVQLDADGQAELLRELIPALNDGRVQLRTSRPPF